MTPVRPRPAASVLLVRPGARSPLEVWMIRRRESMRFLGGFYAFPGGALDPADGDPAMAARCRGLDPAGAAHLIPAGEGVPPLAYWVAAARECLEETGVCWAADAQGRPIAAAEPAVADRVAALRRTLLEGREPLGALLEREAWWLDLRPFRYLSHFITPASSPIRFSARFFLAPLPPGQEPVLHRGEASEGFWMDPAEGHRRWRLGQMPMAEPADCGLGYLAQFESLEDLWQAHADGRHKFHGILDRVEAAGVDIRRDAAARACAPGDGPPAS